MLFSDVGCVTGGENGGVQGWSEKVESSSSPKSLQSQLSSSPQTLQTQLCKQWLLSIESLQSQPWKQLLFSLWLFEHKDTLSQVWSGACAHLVGRTVWGGTRRTDEVKSIIAIDPGFGNHLVGPSNIHKCFFQRSVGHFFHCS